SIPCSRSGELLCSMPLSLFAKCKCENSHRSDMEKGGNHGSPLVHRHRPSVTRSPLMVEHKAMVDGLYVVVGRIAKPLVGKVYRTIKQRITDFLTHARILTQGQGSAYSYFPVVHFIHASTVCLDHANKN